MADDTLESDIERRPDSTDVCEFKVERIIQHCVTSPGSSPKKNSSRRMPDGIGPLMFPVICLPKLRFQSDNDCTSQAKQETKKSGVGLPDLGDQPIHPLTSCEQSANYTHRSPKKKKSTKKSHQTDRVSQVNLLSARSRPAKSTFFKSRRGSISVEIEVEDVDASVLSQIINSPRRALNQRKIKKERVTKQSNDSSLSHPPSSKAKIEKVPLNSTFPFELKRPKKKQLSCNLGAQEGVPKNKKPKLENSVARASSDTKQNATDMELSATLEKYHPKPKKLEKNLNKQLSKDDKNKALCENFERSSAKAKDIAAHKEKPKPIDSDVCSPAVENNVQNDLTEENLLNIRECNLKKRIKNKTHECRAPELIDHLIDSPTQENSGDTEDPGIPPKKKKQTCKAPVLKALDNVQNVSTTDQSDTSDSQSYQENTKTVVNKAAEVSMAELCYIAARELARVLNEKKRAEKSVSHQLSGSTANAKNEAKNPKNKKRCTVQEVEVLPVDESEESEGDETSELSEHSASESEGQYVIVDSSEEDDAILEFRPLQPLPRVMTRTEIYNKVKNFQLPEQNIHEEHLVESRVLYDLRKPEKDALAPFNMIYGKRWTAEEDAILLANWDEFKEIYGFEQEHWQCFVINKITTTKTLLNFYRFVGRGLQKRTLQSIHARFQHIMKFGTKKEYALYTNEENDYIIKFLSTYKGTDAYSRLAKTLQREKSNLRMHCKQLQMKAAPDFPAGLGPRQLPKESLTKFVKTAMELVGKKTVTSLLQVKSLPISKIVSELSISKAQVFALWVYMKYALKLDSKILRVQLVLDTVNAIQEQNCTELRGVNWDMVSNKLKPFHKYTIRQLFDYWFKKSDKSEILDEQLKSVREAVDKVIAQGKFTPDQYFHPLPHTEDGVIL